MKCYLRMGSDTLEEAKRCYSLTNAKHRFAKIARELAQFGQEIDATVHIAQTREELTEDADYHLALSERGAVVRTKL